MSIDTHLLLSGHPFVTGIHHHYTVIGDIVFHVLFTRKAFYVSPYCQAEQCSTSFQHHLLSTLSSLLATLISILLLIGQAVSSEPSFLFLILGNDYCVVSTYLMSSVLFFRAVCSMLFNHVCFLF